MGGGGINIETAVQRAHPWGGVVSARRAAGAVATGRIVPDTFGDRTGLVTGKGYGGESGRGCACSGDRGDRFGPPSSMGEGASVATTTRAPGLSPSGGG